MSLTPETQALRDHFFQTFLDAARPLQRGPDPEATLEALVEAAGLLQDRFRTELAELRLEQVD
ncbi:MAG: hypothetical protein JWO38_4843 [Gemmataceae bacterium]|nr:hypothetical protein [Gemmataceae bacterium]